MSKTPHSLFGHLEDNEVDAILIPKKIKARNFPADFRAQNFLGWGEPLCCHFIDCCVVSWVIVT